MIKSLESFQYSTLQPLETSILVMITFALTNINRHILHFFAYIYLRHISPQHVRGCDTVPGRTSIFWGRSILQSKNKAFLYIRLAAGLCCYCAFLVSCLNVWEQFYVLKIVFPSGFHLQEVVPCSDEMKCATPARQLVTELVSWRRF